MDGLAALAGGLVRGLHIDALDQLSQGVGRQLLDAYMQNLVFEKQSERWHSRCRKAAFEGFGAFPRQAIYKTYAEQNFRKRVNRALFTLLANL